MSNAAWTCPKCGQFTEQPERVAEVSHWCRKVRKRVQFQRLESGAELRTVDGPGTAVRATA